MKVDEVGTLIIIGDPTSRDGKHFFNSWNQLPLSRVFLSPLQPAPQLGRPRGKDLLACPSD
ncbi:uncharacterized protein PgNI_04227 [Pyricularia grisea]|uniref:Uncharacterized protein n=1 Tax=Pyricularia grisea TaxID=148305 RepID=A0A6P8B858_PYRGI|nr:uncharacterized protein PgNI_04227 [Pyricularia grisea]TLD12035.1 hypothetical protein PgNI_04227 [Pyricularia grisea]